MFDFLLYKKGILVYNLPKNCTEKVHLLCIDGYLKGTRKEDETPWNVHEITCVSLWGVTLENILPERYTKSFFEAQTTLKGTRKRGAVCTKKYTRMGLLARNLPKRYTIINCREEIYLKSTQKKRGAVIWKSW